MALRVWTQEKIERYPRAWAIYKGHHPDATPQIAPIKTERTKRKPQPWPRTTGHFNRPEVVGARLAKYGITHQRTLDMFLSQDGRCAICRRRFDGGSFVVDHCHKRGHVRGLLCYPCNSGLGMFKDNPNRLVAAANYLAGQLSRGAAGQIIPSFYRLRNRAPTRVPLS